MRRVYENARVLDARGRYTGSVVTEGGAIVYAAPGEYRGPADERTDVSGRLLMPAFIDLHCHLRDPGYPQKEDMASGMRAALSGGYATLCAMANTDPVTETAEQVERNCEKAKALSLCRLYQAAAAGEGLGDDKATDYKSLSRVTPIISNDGKTIFSDDFMAALLTASAEYGFFISTHCQPERRTVARDIALLEKTGGELHVGHISHRETLQMIREAKARGLMLTCEVTPHHLFAWDSDYKVNPPIRSEADVAALIAGVADGTVDCLSTDHAPHTEADKARGMAGISNIEHAAEIFIKVFCDNGIPLERMSGMLSLNPAKRLRVKRGLIEPGYEADMVILDADEPRRIQRDEMISRSRNTPFDGRQAQGRIYRTIVEGETRYDNGLPL